MAKKSYLTPSEVAELLMVSPTAVRLWAEKGELKALTTPGGHRRFLHSEVDLFASRRGLTLNDGKSSQTRILIIDDDQQLARYLSKFLEGIDTEILIEVAHDGFEAGLKILDFKPQIILLDIMMPHLSGIEVCTRLKKDPESSSIRVIGMTGYPSKENTRAIINAGAEICLTKPIDEKLLLKQLAIT